MSWITQNNVVVPFDFSDHATEAVSKAIQLSTDPSNIHVLHVLPRMEVTEPGVVWGTVDDESRIQNVLESMTKALPESEFGKTSFEVQIGDAGSVAVKRAEELGAELIIIGSHGRTGISRVVLGSVAERIVRFAKCPVLVVKLPQNTTQRNSTES